LGDGNNVLSDLFGSDLLVDDRLNVVLNVVNMSVNFTLAFDFFNLDVTVVSVNDVVQVLVIMSDVLGCRIKFGANGVVVAFGVVKMRSSSG